MKEIITCIGITVHQEINNNQNKCKKLKVSSIKKWSENTKYGRYPQSDDFDDLPLVYKQTLFT